MPINYSEVCTIHFFDKAQNLTDSLIEHDLDLNPKNKITKHII